MPFIIWKEKITVLFSPNWFSQFGFDSVSIGFDTEREIEIESHLLLLSLYLLISERVDERGLRERISELIDEMRLLVTFKKKKRKSELRIDSTAAKPDRRWSSTYQRVGLREWPYRMPAAAVWRGKEQRRPWDDGCLSARFFRWCWCSGLFCHVSSFELLSLFSNRPPFVLLLSVFAFILFPFSFFGNFG